jgi:hypothetical protein
MSAEQAIKVGRFQTIDQSNFFHYSLLRIAQDSDWLLNQVEFNVELERIQALYQLILIQKGLASYTSKVHTRKLIKNLNVYYSCQFLESLQCKLEEASKNDSAWSTKTVSSSYYQAPLKHLLLIHYLGFNAKSFLQATRDAIAYKSLAEEPLNETLECLETPNVTNTKLKQFEPDCSSTNCLLVHTVKDYRSLWEQTLKKLWENPQVSLKGMAEELGVDKETVKSHAARLGLSFPRQGSGNESILSPEDASVSKTSQLDSSARLQKYRSEWLTALEQKPDLGRTELTNELTRVFSWLYKHDKQWLQEHLPAKRTTQSRKKSLIDWEKRDIEYEIEVRRAAEHLASLPSKPVKLTKASILAESNCTSLNQWAFEKLPRTTEALTELIETKEAFAIRRVNWAIACYRQEGNFPTASQLALRAGIDPRVRAKPEVQEAIATALAPLNCYLPKETTNA